MLPEGFKDVIMQGWLQRDHIQPVLAETAGKWQSVALGPMRTRLTSAVSLFLSLHRG